MTPEEIRKKKEEILERINDLQRDIELQRLELKRIQIHCKHVNTEEYTAMGDPTKTCRDCEKTFY